jgi:hypothetical protein
MPITNRLKETFGSAGLASTLLVFGDRRELLDRANAEIRETGL